MVVRDYDAYPAKPSGHDVAFQSKRSESLFPLAIREKLSGHHRVMRRRGWMVGLRTSSGFSRRPQMFRDKEAEVSTFFAMQCH